MNFPALNVHNTHTHTQKTSLQMAVEHNNELLTDICFFYTTNKKKTNAIMPLYWLNCFQSRFTAANLWRWDFCRVSASALTSPLQIFQLSFLLFFYDARFLQSRKLCVLINGPQHGIRHKMTLKLSPMHKNLPYHLSRVRRRHVFAAVWVCQTSFTRSAQC